MGFDHVQRSTGGEQGTSTAGGGAPGKRSRTEGLAVQRRAATSTPPAGAAGPPAAESPAGEDPFAVHLLASDGIAGPSTALPHQEAIQASFGPHDVSGIEAHVGGPAADAAQGMGATAFATGHHVAFASAPDLHTAAHEAAHVVQQARGVNLYGGVGQAGDAYEQQADAVADRVVAGQSAVDLLGDPGVWGGPAPGVQRKITAPIVQRDTGGPGGAAAAGAGGAAAAAGGAGKVARLHLFVDVDVKSLGLKELQEGAVGHTWIAIEYNDPAQVPDTVHADHKDLLRAGGRYADPMGFWPDIANGVGYSTNPFDSYVQGWMRHPDRAHEGSEKAVQTWELTQAEVDAVIRYAESKRGAKYSVYFFNCTTFGREAVQAAGKSAPSMSTGGICFPNAAYDGIKKRQEQGIGTTEVTDLDTGNVTSAAHADPGGKRGR